MFLNILKRTRVKERLWFLFLMFEYLIDGRERKINVEHVSIMIRKVVVTY